MQESCLGIATLLVRVPLREDGNFQKSKTCGALELEKQFFLDTSHSLSVLESMKGSPHKQEIQLSWEDLLVGRCIGKGGFCSVFHVSIRRKPTADAKNGSLDFGRQYALKHLNETLENKDTSAEDLALEAKLLSRLKHANIITLHGVASADECSRGKFLVLDLLTTTLDKKLTFWGNARKKQRGFLFRRKNLRQERAALLHRIEYAAIGIARGMEYLHEHNIVYRDLKPHNVGFDEQGQVRIFDFGLARISGTEMIVAGSPRYMAPEQNCDLKVDVYSFAILLWEICCCTRAFEKIACLKAFHSSVVKGMRPCLNSVACGVLKGLLCESWDADPKCRPSFCVIRETLERLVEQESNDSPYRQ